jgi:hypothetical protein
VVLDYLIVQLRPFWRLRGRIESRKLYVARNLSQKRFPYVSRGAASTATTQVEPS